MRIQKLITPFLHNKLFHTSYMAFLHYQFSTKNYKYPAIKVVKPSDKGISLYKIATNINNMPKLSTQQKESMISTLLQLLASNKTQLTDNQRQELRRIILKFDDNSLFLLPLNYLKLFIQLYNFCKKQEIIFKGARLQMQLYKEILRRIEQVQTNESEWSQLIKFYELISVFEVHLHRQLCKIPKIFNNSINQKWKCKIQNMLPILRGLSKRQYLHFDERSALVKIISVSNRIYQELSSSHKIQIVKEVVKVNASDRYGFKISSSQELLASFCNDLENGKIKIWEEKVYEIMQNNLPPSMKVIQSIEKIIFKELIQHFAKNKEKVSEEVIDIFYFVIAHYTRKNQYSKLSESEKTTILQFFKRQLQKPNTFGAVNKIQILLSNLISNDFFGTHIQVVKTELIPLLNLQITPLLYLQLSISGITFKQPMLQNLLKDGGHIVRMNVTRQMDHTDIMVLLAAKMRSIFDFTVDNYRIVFQRYHKQFIEQSRMNVGRMMKELSKLSSVHLYYLFKQCEIDQIMDLFQDREVIQDEKQKHIYLSFILKYFSYQGLLASKKFSMQDIRLMLYILNQELKGKTGMHYYSSDILTYCFKIVELYHDKKPQYLILTSISKIFDFMSQLTSLLRDRRLSILDKDIFVRYWQLIFLFMGKIQSFSVTTLWSIKLKQLISLIIDTDQGHLSQTPQYTRFLQVLLKNLAKFQENYDIVNKIVTVCIYVGELNRINFKEYIWPIKRVLQLKGQPKEIIDAWVAEREGLQPIQSECLITKFVGKTKNFNPEEIDIQKSKYSLVQLGKILELYNLPSETKKYQKIYLVLFLQLKKRNFRTINLNFLTITQKLFNLSYCYEFAAEFQEKGVAKMLLNVILNNQRDNFKNTRLQYTQNLIRNIGKMMIFDRDYEKLMFQKIISEQIIKPQTISACLITLIKQQYGFNYKDLKRIEEIMMRTQCNFMLPFLMLEEKIKQDNKRQLLKKIFKQQPHEKVLQQKQLNNRLVHNYLKKKYPQFYNQSQFSLKQKQSSFVQKPNILLKIKHFAALKKLFEGLNEIRTLQILGNEIFMIKQNVGLGFLTHKRLPAETNLVRKLLMSEAPELKELFIIRVGLNDRKIIDEVIQECNLTINDQKKLLISSQFKISFAEYWEDQRSS